MSPKEKDLIDLAIAEARNREKSHSFRKFLSKIKQEVKSNERCNTKNTE